MNLKEAIRILAQFDELFGDGGNGDDEGDEEKKEVKWQFPEAWETEVVEADWVGIPKEIRRAISKVGDDPNEVLELGIETRRRKVIKWALENGADINELDEEKVISLCRRFPIGFLEKIMENYVTDERLRRFIYNRMLIGGIYDQDKNKVKVALENGADINELDKNKILEWGIKKRRKWVVEWALENGADISELDKNKILKWGIERESEKVIIWALENGADISKLNRGEVRYLCFRFPADFLEEIIENYVTDERVKQLICDNMLTAGLWKRDELKVKIALENGADINKCGSELKELAYVFPFNSIKKVIKNYVTDGMVIQLINNGMLERGIWNWGERKVKAILENGASINELDEETLERLGYRFSVDFVEEVIENYVTDEEVKQFIYKGMLERGIKDRDKRKVKVALENGAEVSGKNKEKLDALFGPDWKKYLPRRR